MKKQWRIVLGLVLILIIVVFAILNNGTVNVNFLVWHMKAPLILIILGSAIIGVMIAVLTSTSTMWGQKKMIKTLEKELVEYQEDFNKKILERKDELERKYEIEMAELRAGYEGQLKEKERQISQLTGSSDFTEGSRSSHGMDYFD